MDWVDAMLFRHLKCFTLHLLFIIYPIIPERSTAANQMAPQTTTKHSLTFVQAKWVKCLAQWPKHLNRQL